MTYEEFVIALCDLLAAGNILPGDKVCFNYPSREGYDHSADCYIGAEGVITVLP